MEVTKEFEAKTETFKEDFRELWHATVKVRFPGGGMWYCEAGGRSESEAIAALERELTRAGR